QIAAALIAFLVLRLAQQTQTAIHSPLAFARLVKTNLLHVRCVTQLLHPPAKPVNQVVGQGVFRWNDAALNHV
ncbi:MAG TPA: hypothetical protein VGM42_01360, partial [Rhodopila sp.]